VGETLIAETSEISDADGLGSFNYAWQRSTDGGVTWITTGSDSSYTLSEADVGADIRVAVSYTDAQLTTESLMSDHIVLASGSTPEPPTDNTPESTGPVPPTTTDDPSDPVAQPGGSPTNPDPKEVDDTPPPGSDGEPVNVAEAPEAGDDRVPGSTRGSPPPQAIPDVIAQLLDAGPRVVDEGGAEAARQEVAFDAVEHRNITTMELDYVASQSSTAVEMEYVEKVLNNPAMWRGIDAMMRDMDETGAQTEAFVVEVVSTTGAGMMAGLVAYALRGGALMASLLSTMPVLRTYDPLPILAANKKKKKEEELVPENEDDRPAAVEALFE